MKTAIAGRLVALTLLHTDVFLSAAEPPAKKDDPVIVAFVGLRPPGNGPRGDVIPRLLEAAANEAAVPKEVAQQFHARTTDYVYFMGFGAPRNNSSPPTFKLPTGVLSARQMLEKAGMPDAVELSFEPDDKPTRRIKRLFYDRSVFQSGTDETIESLTVYPNFVDAVNFSKLSPAPGYEKELKRPSAKWGTIEQLMDKLLKETPRTQTELRQKLGDWWKTKTLRPDRRSLVYTCEDGLLIVVVDPSHAARK